MPNYIDIRNVKFLLHEMLEVEKLTNYEYFQEYDKESFDMLLDSTLDYADQYLYPTFREMDEKPAYYKDGKIIVHEFIGEYMKYAGENGLVGALFPYEHGGLQMPFVIEKARHHIEESANNNVTGYSGLTTGAAELIVEFGSQELIDTYVPKMLAAEWAGTMCLTEPQAGSSLSDVMTSAKPKEDGSYAIEGQKIFISGGDHEYHDNFVHLVLARIDGAPAGTKGISLFVVPKKRIQEDGSLTSNDVQTVGDFQKLGQRGYCTTHLVFGENKDCQGWLVGEANQGLKNMFLMMNGARIAVGTTAASMATGAYQASLQYAKERPQGRRVKSGGEKDVSKEQELIIKHPDVRRMLLLQKAVCEGSVALIFQTAMYRDLVMAGEDVEKHKLLIEILTPIVKTYPSEMGQVAISNGLQVLGGYGFTSEFILQQYYRDIRITSLYEGTTGIQSLDLLGRKTVMKNGAAMKALSSEIIATIKEAAATDGFAKYAEELKQASKKQEEVLMFLIGFAMKGENERFLSDATIYMELMSTVVLSWIWLRQGMIAKKCLQDPNRTYQESYYKAKIETMKYYFKYELPKVYACAETLMDEDVITMYKEGDQLFD